MAEIGRKDDAGKNPWRLLPWGPVQEVVRVLEFGARKYSPDNWMHVDHAEDRYFDAALRHVVAYKLGERVDADSGLHPLAHAVCDLLFLLWFELREQSSDAARK